MTNEEKIKEIFPNSHIDEGSHTVRVGYEVLDVNTLEIIIERADELARELEQLKPTTENEVKYCDRNICLKNEYNNIGCEDCEVTKSQKPTTKNDLVHNLCDSCTNIGCEFQSGIVRTTCAFYMPPHLKPDNCGNYVVQSIPVKLNITEIKKHQSDFSDLEQEPTTNNDCAEQNGCITCSLDDGDDCCRKLFEESMQESTIRADDCVSRQFMYELGATCIAMRNENGKLVALGAIDELPSVTPQEPIKGHWITTRTFMHDGEYYCDKCKCESPNNEKWDYCPNCGAKMIEPQESEG